ncbi:hypothetical protein EHO59_04020 [Leptospira semungkisensis]|uniref:Lipoprotein n=1 Tax=Leptospira semungkisensis TaxID=2484985 RepID=A0A4R9G737_9LEPT|nr:hypothetical protein EHO59_04020 [Leptospira semungkisensis]
MELKSRFHFSASSSIGILLCLLQLESCTLLSGLGGNKTLSPKDLPSTRIFWNLSSVPQNSESYRNQPGHLRYLVIQTLPNREKVWNGEVDLWETKEEFQGALPKGMYFPKLSFKASIYTGSTRLEQGDAENPKTVSFLPQSVSSWSWEGDSMNHGIAAYSPKYLTVSDWGIVFDFLPEGIAWVAREYRSLGKDFTLSWENIRNRRSSLSTDYTHPLGLSFPYADYDYRNQIFRYLPFTQDGLPVWIFKEEGDVRWAWGILPEDLLASKNILNRKRTDKEELLSTHFYDANANNPFTARADLRNYPIILLKDYDNARK